MRRPIREISIERRSDDDDDNDTIGSSLKVLESTDTSTDDNRCNLRKLSSHEFSKVSPQYWNTMIHTGEPLLAEETSRIKPPNNKEDEKATANHEEREEAPAEYIPPMLMLEKNSTDSLSPMVDKYNLPGATGDSYHTSQQSLSNVPTGLGTETYASTFVSSNPTSSNTYDDYYTVDDNVSFTFETKFSGTFWSRESGGGASGSESLESDHTPVTQSFAWTCILLSACQFGLLSTQILLCGFASISVNPFLGPYPDAISEFGGKNTYLLLEEEQYYRFITPIFLHVGFVHLLVNVYFQLRTCAYLEQEWGCFLWILVYVVSGFGGCLVASVIDPNNIGVCSSGALMGIFGAKIAQTITWSVFGLRKEYVKQGSNMMVEQLGSVVWSATAVFLLTFLTYIDWSGHLGGLVTGFLAGMTLFSYAIKNPLTRTVWACIGIAGLVTGAIVLLIELLVNTEADEELADECNYFRNLYPEGFVCECAWD